MIVWTEMKCGQCQQRFCLPDETYRHLRASSQNFHCPWGHVRHFPQGPTAEDKLRRERDQLKQEAARLEEQAALQRKWRLEAEEAQAAAERRTSAARGQVTRLKNRAAAGLCPCCNRSFTNLQRHMATKHAGFTVEEVQAEAGQTIQ